MSFTKESYTAKLALLQDTQESIVSISQWVFFHHRHCKECAQIWSSYTLSLLQSPQHSQKVLSLLHLCNDVVQRARRKKKNEFITEFSAVLPEVLNRTYGNLDLVTKAKTDRLISVWKERQVFSSSEISAMTAAIERSKSAPKTPPPMAETSQKNSPVPVAGGRAIAPELIHLNDLFINLNKLNDNSQANLTQFGIQSKTYLPHDPSNVENLPAPPIYISKLNMLEKLGKIAVINIKDIQNLKSQITKQLNSLIKLVDEPSNTDETKIQIINDKLAKLTETRAELQQMEKEENENSLHNDEKEDTKKTDDDEEPSPTMDDDLGDELPKYEDDDDDDVPTYEADEQEPTASENNNENLEKEAKQNNLAKLEKRPSEGPEPPSKRVAFSEDVEVKEYEREEHHDSPESPDTSYPNADDDGDDDDGYDPSSDMEGSQSDNSDVMSLLSKLA